MRAWAWQLVLQTGTGTPQTTCPTGSRTGFCLENSLQCLLWSRRALCCFLGGGWGVGVGVVQGMTTDFWE